MEFLFILMFAMVAFIVPVVAVSTSPDCRDREMTCRMLVENIPNFCYISMHSKYSKENCQESCGFCQVKTVSVNHGTNLIWAQTPLIKMNSYSRLMSIQGDPETWVTSRKPQINYINAPIYTWEFKALGFHWEDETLYWSESMNKRIQSLVLNGSTDIRSIFAGTSPEVYGIAVDWLSRNLYFTDALYNWVMMTSSNPNQPAYRIVVQDNLDSPHGVAVHPQKGYLIWSDWGERPKIEIADLLGQNRRTLVETNIVKPRGLTVDFSSNSLYWVDSFKSTVEVIQFNGLGRQVIQQEDESSFYSVALYNDFIFVTEQNRRMLKVFNKKQSLVSFTLWNVPYDIIMYDGSQQQGNSSECESMGCEQMCVLDPLTGAKCLCGEGYLPENELSTSCKASKRFVHPSHIYAILDSICQYPANLADMSLSAVTLESQCFLEEKQGYMTLTFDARENMLYYFANGTKTISRLPLEMGGKSKVLTGGTGVVKGMALDWVSGNLYWTDSTNGVIKVAKKTGSYQMVIVSNLTSPVGIVVHPGIGKIFWADHGRIPDIGARVEKANMDGSGREIVMADNIGEPNHLFIDFQNDMLYWADSMNHHVRQLNLTSGRISVVFELSMVKFYGLSLFKDFILWTDTEDLNGIHIARMDTKEKVRGVIHPRNGQASDLITFDIQNQPSFNNSCQEGTSTCSQLCLVSPKNNFTCFCGVGYELSLDGFTCTTSPAMDNFLLVNDAYQRQIFQVNLKTAVVEAVDLQPTHEPIAVAYDPFEVKVYWSDNKVNVIKEATIDGKYEKTVMLLNNASMCDGLSADYINKLLFFTDTGNNVIGVVSMRNYKLFTYIINANLDEPRDIVVHPNQGRIYWSDWGMKPRIEKSNMDGSERETVVDFDKAAWPNGLALDIQENKLFWVDAHADKISVIDLGSKEVKTLVMEKDAHYFSVDVVGSYLYVTDWKTNYLRRMSKYGGPLKQFGPAEFTRLYGIKGYNSSERFTGISVCVFSACEHLCLPKESNQFTCRCTEGYIEDGSFCIKKIQSTTEMPITLPMSISTSSSPSTAQQSTTQQSSIQQSTIQQSSIQQSTTVQSSTQQSTIQQSTMTDSQSATTSQQTTSPPSSTVASRTNPSTMTCCSEGGQSSTESEEINTTLQPATDSTTKSTMVTSTASMTSVSSVSSTNATPPDGSNATVLMSSEGDAPHALSATVIGLIVAGVVFVIVAIIIGAVVYRRRYKYYFSHGKLVEEKNPADFYKIAFPDRGGDSVTFDTGIENPTYDCLHDPTNSLATRPDASMT